MNLVQRFVENERELVCESILVSKVQFVGEREKMEGGKERKKRKKREKREGAPFTHHGCTR